MIQPPTDEDRIITTIVASYSDVYLYLLNITEPRNKSTHPEGGKLSETFEELDQGGGSVTGSV